MERRAQRYTVWLPVKIEELPGGMAVTHNASGRGVLLVTAAELAVGSPVSVVIQFPTEGAEDKRIEGQVVRVEPNVDDPDSMWPHRLAVEFAHEVPELELALASLASAGIAKIQR